jgi:hypothetical protein
MQVLTDAGDGSAQMCTVLAYHPLHNTTTGVDVSSQRCAHAHAHCVHNPHASSAGTGVCCVEQSAEYQTIDGTKSTEKVVKPTKLEHKNGAATVTIIEAIKPTTRGTRDQRLANENRITTFK